MAAMGLDGLSFVAAIIVIVVTVIGVSAKKNALSPR
jgi:hypothetical protein